MNTLTKLSAALWLILALAPMPASATVELRTSVACGTNGFQHNSSGVASYCSNAGTALTVNNQGSFDYRIQATAATGYELGGLRTAGKVVFDGLQQGRVGAYDGWPAGTRSTATLADRLHFSLPTAAPGSTLTMHSRIRMHGNNAFPTVDASKFYDGNSASMISELSVLGLGFASSGHQFHSSVNISNATITELGSSDDITAFQKSLTLDANSSFSSTVQLQLMTTLRLVNGFPGSVGVGSGTFDADFSSTAGVESIEFFDSQGQSIAYSLTTESGDFAFLTPVPEPSSSAMLLLGLGAVAGFVRRRRRSGIAAAA